MGKVVLVGAGPGDTGLLTLKGEKYIRQADCLVYDRLSSPDFLSMAKSGCELIYVGKENHKHVLKQDAINQLLYEKARVHELVVRLKGGDPYVFGRGGEEALYLVERQVEVEVVPGVSSSIATLADAGIPITHRGVAKGFQVITAHSRKDREADIDYSLLTDPSITCVFLMGLAHVKNIAEGLMKAGRNPDTPAAVISNGTLANQRKCVGTLQDIGDKIREANLKSPAIIVVGDVVSLSDRLNFFEKRPLFGRRIFVPYIEAMGTGGASEALGSNELISSLQKLGAKVDAIKTGKINPILISDFKETITEADWILFTSKNGVRSFFYNLEMAGADIRAIGRAKFGVVGKATAKELEAHHIYPDLIPGMQTGEGLALALNDSMNHIDHLDRKLKVCIFGAREADGDLEAGLSGICQAKKIDAYVNETVEGSRRATIRKDIGNPIRDSSIEAALEDPIQEAVFTSASNVHRFFQMMPENLKVERAYSIGEKTTAALQTYPVGELVEAKNCSYEGLIDLIERRSGAI